MSSVRLIYLPVVASREELDDILSRAAWFLTFSKLDRITVPVAEPALTDTPWSVAAGMDGAIAERFGVLRELIELVPVASEADLAPLVERASKILRWRRDSRDGWLAPATLSRWLAEKTVVSVDPSQDRYEGSFYIDLSRELMPRPDLVVAEGKAKLTELRGRLGRFSRARVLATGPSIDSYARFDYENSLNVVCNTVILNHDLMSKVRPQFLVFADPIFHFGPSEYAGSFRESVRAAAAEFDFEICLPLKYHEVCVAAMPELADRIIAIPYRKDREWSFDLVDDFELKTTANILTFLMLPLAATFSDRIGVLGCDGRPLDEDSYFWKHGETTQISHKMANIRQVHPAFFAIAYNDYYLEHCEVLSTQLDAGEALGVRFECLGPSHIPALRARQTSGDAAGVPALRRRADRGPNVLVIDPDAMDWSGHFMAYNDKLAAALEARSASVKVICNKGLQPSILAERPNFVPRLSVHSWMLGNRFASAAETAAAERELTDAIRALTHGGEAVAYMYTGAVEHAAILARIAAEEAGFRAQVNLFWAAFQADRWRDWVERYRETLHDIASAAPRLHVTVPTEGIQRAIADATGLTFEMAPHPSTALTDEGFEREHVNTGAPALPDRLSILFPGVASDGKGFERTVEAASMLARVPGIKPMIRHRIDQRVGDIHGEAIAGLDERVVVITGELDNQAFLDLFSRAHVSVLPYEPSAFANRTSGLMIDSIYHGLPVVAVQGTWLGDMIERFGCGVAVADHAPERLAGAVRKIADDYAGFAGRAREAARVYFKENSWKALADTIVETSTQADPLVGPYPREAKAHLDESPVVAKLVKSGDSVEVTTGADVWKGVPWERIAPDVIECEFEDLKTASLGHTYRDVADYLVERGYTVYLSEWHPIVRYGINHQWRALLRYPARLASVEAWGNMLAFRDDPGAQALEDALRGELEVEEPGTRGGVTEIEAEIDAALDRQEAVWAAVLASIRGEEADGEAPRLARRPRNAPRPARRLRNAPRPARRSGNVEVNQVLAQRKVASFGPLLEAYRTAGISLDCAIDGGAGSGNTAKAMLPHLDGFVYAFEPFPGNHRFFEGCDQRIKLIPHALAERDKTMSFRVSSVVGADSDWGRRGMQGYSSLGRLVTGAGEEDLTVKCVSADEELPSDREISFVKLDLQGGELNALKGMTGLLPEVSLMWIEFLGSMELLEFIAGQGFLIFDTEYMFRGEPSEAARKDFDITREGAPLSTGAKIWSGFKRTRWDSFPEEFSRFQREYSLMQTDLVCINSNRAADFLRALQFIQR